MGFSIAYMTAGGMEDAERIARALVQERLAACVNIVDRMRSIYLWEGTLQDEREVVLIAKTRSARMPDLIKRVQALHSYDCPCILEFKVAGGNAAFLDWIGKGVSPPRGDDE